MPPPKTIVYKGTTYFLDNLNIGPGENAEEVVDKLHREGGYNRLVGAEMRCRRQDEQRQQEEKRNGDSSAPRQDHSLGAGAKASAGVQKWPSTLTLRAEGSQFPISGKVAAVLKDELRSRLQGSDLVLPIKKVTLGHLVNFMKLVVTSPPGASGLGVNMTLNWRMQDAVSVYREVRQAVLELTKEAYHHHWPRNLPLQCFTPHGFC